MAGQVAGAHAWALKGGWCALESGAAEAYLGSESKHNVLDLLVRGELEPLAVFRHDPCGEQLEGLWPELVAACGQPSQDEAQLPRDQPRRAVNCQALELGTHPLHLEGVAFVQLLRARAGRREAGGGG